MISSSTVYARERLCRPTCLSKGKELKPPPPCMAKVPCTRTRFMTTPPAPRLSRPRSLTSHGPMRVDASRTGSLGREAGRGWKEVEHDVAESAAGESSPMMKGDHHAHPAFGAARLDPLQGDGKAGREGSCGFIDAPDADAAAP